jgi:hypothetical protein
MVKDKRQVRELKGFRARPYAHGWELQANYVYFEGKNSGKSVWEADSFFSTFENTCLAIIDKKLQLLLDNEDPQNLVKAIQEAKAEAIKVAQEFKITYQEAHKVVNNGADTE